MRPFEDTKRPVTEGELRAAALAHGVTNEELQQRAVRRLLDDQDALRGMYREDDELERQIERCEKQATYAQERIERGAEGDWHQEAADGRQKAESFRRLLALRTVETVQDVNGDTWKLRGKRRRLGDPIFERHDGVADILYCIEMRYGPLIPIPE